MLTKITVRNLKRLRQAEITLTDSVIFAGPNNFGKTTVLQALSIWHFATRRWIDRALDVIATSVPIARIPRCRPEDRRQAKQKTAKKEKADGAQILV